jgi:hypothetical protein
VKATDELLHLANQIEALEEQTAQITSSWYQFAPGNETHLQQVAHLTAATRGKLEQLSTRLDAELRTPQVSPSKRQQLQYAYNTVQELLQSRQAAVDMASSIITQPGTAYQEYLRALALKEKAAAAQVNKLVDTLVQLYGG